MTSGSSSGYSSTERALLAQFNGAEKKGKNSVGNQLLQRVVRLQHELKRKDEEIAKLRENAILPSTTGERVKGHLDEYRIALAEMKAENEKLRGVIAQNQGAPTDDVKKDWNEVSQKKCCTDEAFRIRPSPLRASDVSTKPNSKLLSFQRVAEAEHARHLQEIVFQTFFTVAVSELEDINKTLVKRQS